MNEILVSKCLIIRYFKIVVWKKIKFRVLM